MNKKILITALSLICVAACKKDQFTTKPQLTFKSVNATSFVQGDQMEFVLDYTDKEGDIQDSLYFEEVTKDPDCSSNNFKAFYAIPQDVPETKNAKGTIVVRFSYRVIDPNGQIPTYSGPQCQRNDTCYFRFALTDKAKNTSDTVESPQIVLVY